MIWVYGIGMAATFFMLSGVAMMVMTDIRQARSLQEWKRKGILIDPSEDQPILDHKAHEVDADMRTLFPEDEEYEGVPVKEEDLYQVPKDALLQVLGRLIRREPKA